MRVLWKVYLDQCENVRDHHRLDDTWAGLERSWRSMCGAGVQCSGRGKAETVAQKLELAEWAGSSRNEGGRRKASSEGSVEWVLGVSAILTLTFQSLIGFLAILWSSCGNLWGWRKAECFYPCVVFFPFDESPDMWNPPPFPVLLSNLILAFKMGSKKKEKKRAIDLYVSVISLGTRWAFTLGWLRKRPCLWLDLSGSGCVTLGTWGNKTTGNCQCLHAQRAVCCAVQ